jgi:hypothetical protein
MVFGTEHRSKKFQGIVATPVRGAARYTVKHAKHEPVCAYRPNRSPLGLRAKRTARVAGRSASAQENRRAEAACIA